MDIYEMLRSDHRQVNDMLASLAEKDMTLAERENMFMQLQKAFWLHSKAEEMVFYDALRRRDETFNDNILRSLREHEDINRIFLQLEGMKGGKSWFHLLEKLTEIITTHLDKEETEVFSVAESNFSEEEVEILAEQFKAKKHEIETGAEQAA